ncbi:MAG: DUF2784 domain-containing protein [Gammaproteobacteria bacterium]
MLWRILADLVVVTHLAFVVFVVAGGLLALKWPKVVWLHIPALIWGMVIEFTGWICPLTPLENAFRHLGGLAGYEGGFIEHYLKPLLYPAGLTPTIQWALGIGLFALNAVVYWLIIQKWKRNLL